MFLPLQSPTSADQENAAYVSIVAPTIPVEHLRAAENVGIALANKLKADGADVIVQKAKATIAAEIIMDDKMKKAAIAQAQAEARGDKDLNSGAKGGAAAGKVTSS